MDEIFEEDLKSKKKEEKLRKKYKEKAEKLIKKEEKKSEKKAKKEQKKNESKKPIDKMKIAKAIVAIILILAMLFSVCGTLLYYVFLDK